MRLRRLAAALGLAAVLATACGGGPGATGGDGPRPCAAEPVASDGRDVERSGLGWIFGEELPADFPAPTIDQSDFVPVLGPDRIPAIDEPRCLTVGEVDFLDEAAAVVTVTVDGDTRAYPLEILTWHELVNDTIGGRPVTVSYCPLCNSAIAYDRRVGDRILDFGTSGALTQSSMVMYDRQTETLWTHFDGRAVAGELTGARLELLSAPVVSWASFRDAFPDALVLSRDTGHERDYGRNPYPGYGNASTPIVAFMTSSVDDRLALKRRVVGVELDGGAAAVLHDHLFDAGVVELDLAGRELTVWSLPGTASALDRQSVAGGDDVGATSVFVPSADGSALTFARVEGGFRDDQTGSTWNIFGEAVAGPLAGERLERVSHVDTFWFAWATFFEDTAIVPDP